ncbi:MAG: histidine kinase dimerization/phosphoacceptor domain -containing protein, partial [Bacteroidota bacterium]
LKLQEFDSAYDCFLKSVDISKYLKKYYLLEPAYQNLYEYYTQTKQWEKALKTYQLYIIARDSVIIIKNREETVVFEANQIITENERKNSILLNENQVQRVRLNQTKIIMSLMGSILFIIGLAFMSQIRQNIKMKKSYLRIMALNRKLDREVHEKIMVEDGLKASEHFYHFIADHVRDVITRTDAHGKRIYISPSCIDLYGYTQNEMMAMKYAHTLVEPSQLESLKVSFYSMNSEHEPAKVIYKCRQKEGKVIWVESNMNPIFDAETGAMTEIVSVTRDLTERISQEEHLKATATQKEMLMREIHHRAKNNFGILNSLLNIQKVQIKDKVLRAIISELQFRIKTMVIVHEQLYRNSSVDMVLFGSYLESLVSTVAIAFRTSNVEVHMNIEPCALNIETALPLGLITNELLTNAFKYAFQGRKGGGIDIRFSSFVEKDKDDQEIIFRELSVKDDGNGLPPTFSLDDPASMGSTIILALIGQIHGKVQFYNDNGACFKITFKEEASAPDEPIEV